jgi:hypothetical protein
MPERLTTFVQEGVGIRPLLQESRERERRGLDGRRQYNPAFYVSS